MGLLDDVLGSAVPRGNVAKPLVIGLAALLGARAVGGGLGSLLGLSADPADRTAGRASRGRSATRRSAGQPQSPAAEFSNRALGPDAVDNLSRLTGLPQDQLVSELSRIHPDTVDKLDPHGRVPDQAEMSRW